ncbi:gamma-glutamyltransferase, partial [bacterium]|nr:gamma-glutamyltransferase [bacterium]
MKYRFSLLLIGLAFSIIVCRQTPEFEQAQRTEPAVGTRGMVSSAHPLATEAGLDILKAGGNAFDAAVTVAAMLNVVEPMMSGIGGYGTIIVHDAKENQSLFLNCSGRIPQAVDSDVYRAPTPNFKENRRGAKAVSTPGNANAWEAMWKRFGTRAWNTLFDGPIKVAEEGFAIDERTARFIERAFPEFPDHAKGFYGNNVEPLKTGDKLIQTDLAGTLRLIAEKGASVIHGGELGRKIDAAMRAAEGFLSLKDLAENKAEWWEPIRIDYRGHEVLTASPPSTAFPSLIRLGLMSRYDIAELGHNSPEFLHRFAEVTKHAFWCRLQYAGSPKSNPPPLEMLLSEAYWQGQVA